MLHMFTQFIVFIDSILIVPRVGTEESRELPPEAQRNTTSEVESSNIFVKLFDIATHSDNDRLQYIYIFTGIVTATVFVTLCRSFIFFNVSQSRGKLLILSVFSTILDFMRLLMGLRGTLTDFSDFRESFSSFFLGKSCSSVTGYGSGSVSGPVLNSGKVRKSVKILKMTQKVSEVGKVFDSLAKSEKSL